MAAKRFNVAQVLLTAIAALTACVMAGWWIHSLPLVQIRPGYALMQFNTTLCTLLCVFAFRSILNAKPDRARLLLLPVFVITSLTLAEYATGRSYGVDTFFITPFTTLYTYAPGRTGVNTSLALLLIAATLLALCRDSIGTRRSLFLAFVSSLIFALGAVPMLGYLGGIEQAYRFGAFTRMSLVAALADIVFGILLIGALHTRSRTLHRWLPLPVFLGLTVISLSSALAINIHEKQQTHQSLQVHADALAMSYSTKLQDFYGALNRIGMRWEAAGGTPKNLWLADTQSYIRDLPFLIAVSWLGEDDKIRWVSPEEGNEALIGRKLSLDPVRGAAIAAVKETHQPRVTPPVALYNHKAELGFLYLRPLIVNDKDNGMMVAAIRIEDFFAALRNGSESENFDFMLEHEGKRFFSTLPQGETPVSEWRTEASLTNLSDQYRLILYPHADYLAAQRTAVATAVLLAGILTAALVAIAMHLWLQAREQARLLGEAEIFNHTIMESASYLIIASDTRGKILMMNAEAERALGYRAAELVGTHTPDIWHDPYEIAEHASHYHLRTGNTYIEGGAVLPAEALEFGQFEREWSIIRKDGTCFPGRLTLTPRRGPDGELLGFLGIIKDMSEQKRQEQLLRSSEETFRLAMENSPIGMALVLPTGRWNKVNKALCDMLGYDRETLLLTDFQTLTHPDDLSTDLELVQQVIAGKIPSYTLEKRYFHKDGHALKILLSVSLVRHEDGTPKYFISMIQDISERDTLMTKLRQTNAELEQFAYVASHDLQEPLRMVIGFVGLLRDNYAAILDDSGKEYIGIAVDAATRMQTLIHDLLDYARLGRENQVRRRIDGNTELSHVLQNLDAAIRATEAKVEVGPLPEILGNPVEFMRLLQNLIGNGIKFHRPGVAPRVSVSVTREDGFWHFIVKDNGIGMEAEYYERVFKPFKRLHTQQEYKGSGIGLAICRSIVENFGGRIWVESLPGEGSTFHFTAPVMETLHI